MSDKPTAEDGHHRWKTDDEGESIDVFAGVEYGFHNGPLCLDCGRAVCHHCHPEVYEEECPRADSR